MKINNLSCVVFSTLINRMGDLFFDLFVAWSITQSQGGVMGAAAILGTSVLWRGVLSLFVGLVVDRCNKRRLLIWSNFCSMAIITLFFAFYRQGLPHFAFCLAYVLANDVNNAFYSRASMLMEADLFTKNEFIRLEACLSVANRLVTTVGSALAGFAIATLNPALFYAVDMASFALAAGAIALIRHEEVLPQRQGGGLKKVVSTVGRDLVETFKTLFSNPFLRRFMVLMVLLNLAYGEIMYLLPLQVADHFGKVELLGGLKAAYSAGAMVGLVLVTKFATRVEGLFLTSMVANVLLFCLMAFVPPPGAFMALFFAYNFFDCFTQPAFSYLVTGLDKDKRGKLLGGIDCVLLATPSIGMWLLTPLFQWHLSAGFLALALLFVIGFFLVVKTGVLREVSLTEE